MKSLLVFCAIFALIEAGPVLEEESGLIEEPELRPNLVSNFFLQLSNSIQFTFKILFFILGTSSIDAVS